MSSKPKPDLHKEALLKLVRMPPKERQKFVRLEMMRRGIKRPRKDSPEAIQPTRAEARQDGIDDHPRPLIHEQR